MAELITKGLLRMLAAMRDAAEDAERTGDWGAAELVVCGREVWLDDRQFHRATVNRALDLLALSDNSDDPTGGLRRYTLNSVGHALLRRPELAREIQQALITGGAWTVDANDCLVQI